MIWILDKEKEYKSIQEKTFFSLSLYIFEIWAIYVIFSYLDEQRWHVILRKENMTYEKFIRVRMRYSESSLIDKVKWK